MLNSLKIFLAVGIFFVLACSDKKEKYFEKLSEIDVKKERSIYTYSSIIILPELGCEGCISDVENFLLSNYKSLNETFIILTRIKSMKLLSLRLGKDVLNQDHIYLDKDNLFDGSDLHTIYPVRLNVNKNKEIDKIIFKDPSNSNFFEDLN